MTRRGPGLLVLLAFASGAAGSAAGDVGAPPRVVRLGDSVVLDREVPTLVLPDTEGALVAVEPKTGKVRWRSSDAVRPLWARDGRVVAQSAGPQEGVLSLTILDAATGERRAAADAPTAPGVVLGPWETPARRFRIDPSDEGASVLLRWSHQAVPLTPVERPEGADRREGTIRVDVASGAVAAAEASPAAPPDEPYPPALRAILETNPWTPAPVRTGDDYVLVLEDRDAGGNRSLRLRRWPRAGGAERSEIRIPGDGFVSTTVSADRRHLLVTRQHLPVVRGTEAWDWEIRSLPSGDRVATLVRPLASSPFVVLDGVLLHETLASYEEKGPALLLHPQNLVAIDLSTAAEVWRRPLRPAGPVDAGVPSVPSPPSRRPR